MKKHLPGPLAREPLLSGKLLQLPEVPFGGRSGPGQQECSRKTKKKACRTKCSACLDGAKGTHCDYFETVAMLSITLAIWTSEDVKMRAKPDWS